MGVPKGALVRATEAGRPQPAFSEPPGVGAFFCAGALGVPGQLPPGDAQFSQPGHSNDQPRFPARGQPGELSLMRKVPAPCFEARPTGVPTSTYPECTVRIFDNVTGARRTLQLPETVEEAMVNCLEVKRAVSHARDLEFAAELPPESPLRDPDAHLAVAVTKTRHVIFIHWWPCGDPELALEKLSEIQRGRAAI